MNLIFDLTSHFCEDNFFMALTMKKKSEPVLRRLLCQLKTCLPLLEFEQYNMSFVYDGYVEIYTTSRNSYFSDEKEAFDYLNQHMKVMKQILAEFEQVNTKARCKNVPPNMPRPKLINHSWILDSCYMHDLFNHEGYKDYVYELFDVMRKCINCINEAMSYCQNALDRVEETRDDAQHCMELLKSFVYDANEDHLLTPSFDINTGQLRVSGETQKFVDVYKRSRNKEEFASKYYHDCTVEGAFAVSYLISQQETDSKPKMTPDALLFNGDQQKKQQVLDVLSRADELYSKRNTKMGSDFLYALIEWGCPQGMCQKKVFLNWVVDNYSGRLKVVKLRALQAYEPDDAKVKEWKTQFLSITNNACVYRRFHQSK